MFQNPNQMVIHRTFGVKLRRLLAFNGGRNLRQDREQQAAFPQQMQSARRVRRTKQFEQFLPNAFGAHIQNFLCRGP